MKYTWRSKISRSIAAQWDFYDIRDLTLGSWQRMGAQGAFIELNGCGGLQGMYVIEVPGAGVITPEKHMYEEVFYALEGAARRRSGPMMPARSRPSSGKRAASSRRR
jgi:hypothetical protein